MSWLSESGDIYKRYMQNMQSRGLRGLDLKTIGLVFDAQFFIVTIYKAKQVFYA